MQIKEIINKIETFAPTNLAEEWDNTGWQIKLEIKTADKILLALSPTLDVIEQAKKLNCNLIITHHPLFFGKIKQITPNFMQNKVAIEAIKNNIQIYCAHTNLDKTQNGINDELAKLLGLKNIEIKGEFVRTGKIEEMPLKEFCLKVKEILFCSNVKLINPCNINTIKKVALCSGSGGDFVNSVNADIFLTGDIKYHTAIEVQNKAILDIGHFESERVILPILKNILNPCEVFIANEKEPWEIL